jgi:predicted DNA-binding transcriptional regulator AlpA
MNLTVRKFDYDVEGTPRHPVAKEKEGLAMSIEISTSSPAARPVPDSGERLISIDDVMTRVGVCRTTLYHLIKSGTFNPPVKIGRSSRWLASEVDAFVRAAAASRPELAARPSG